MPTRSLTKSREPKAGRPQMPGYGIATTKAGILPWKWAAQQLSKSKQYWIATTRPDGTPHLMIIWGLWLDGGFYFSTGKNTRKARNLAANSHCVIGTQDAARAVIVEGEAAPWSGNDMKPLFAAYKKKYKYDVSEMGEPFYRVQPSVAFGLIEKKFPKTATRWKFSR